MSWATLGRNPNDKPASSHGFRWGDEAQAEERDAQNASPETQANAWRYTGHCFLQAAYQSLSDSEFQDRMKQASAAFQHASRIATEYDSPGSSVEGLRFAGLSCYCEANMARDDSAALIRLHETLEFLTSACRAGLVQSRTWSPTLVLELIYVTNDLANYESQLDRRLPLIKTALSVSEKLDTILPTLDTNLSLFLLIELLELSINAWCNLEEYDQRESAGKKALQLLEEVLKRADTIEDPRAAVAALAVQALWGADLLPWKLPTMSPDSLLPRVEATRDRVAIGSLLVASQRTRMRMLAREIEDPDRAKEQLELGEKEASKAILEFSAFGGIRRMPSSVGYVLWTRADFLSVYARSFANSREERLGLVREAVEVSYKIIARAPPIGGGFQYSNLGYYLFDRSFFEEGSERRRTLEEAWKAGQGYQKETLLFIPHWDLGNAEHYLLYGRVKRELAKFSSHDAGLQLLDAVEMFQRAVDLVTKVVESPLVGEADEKRRLSAQYRYELGNAQVELYQKTRDSSLLEKALNNLRQSAEVAAVQRNLSRAADDLARTAEAYVLAGRFDLASSAFRDATERYKEAEKKYPGLSSCFDSRALLMEARAFTTLARGAYLKSRYDAAAGYYREASKLLEGSPSWAGLASLYDGWASLAQAESQTRAEDPSSRWQSAISYFADAEKALKAGAERTVGDDPAVEVQRRLLVQGHRYAEARLLLERARSHERAGELSEGVERLGEAARQFDVLADDADVETQDLMRNHAQLCRASQTMLQAEERLSPDLYSSAAVLFQEAQRASKTRPLAAIAGGWAACCKALELGARYRGSADKSLFEALKKQFAAASSFFVEAGSPVTASWVTATGRMFDAIAYLAEAEATLNPDQRKTHFDRAEHQLRIAAESFEQAGYPARQEDALRYLRSTLEQRQSVPVRLLTPAPFAQSMSTVAGQSISEDVLIGSELASSPVLHVALTGPDKQVFAGRSSHLLLTVLNPGQRAVRLLQVRNLQHQELEFKCGTDAYSISDGDLDLRGKRLAPLETLEIPILAQPSRPGRYTLQPKVLLVDAQGSSQTLALSPLVIEVAEMGLKAWLRGPRR